MLTASLENYTKALLYHVAHICDLLVCKLNIRCIFYNKRKLFEMKRIDPEPISYEGRNEMIEVLKKCYKIEGKDIKPYKQLVKDFDVEVLWDDEEKWEYDYSKPIYR